MSELRVTSASGSFSFVFWVQKSLIDTTETDAKAGETGLVEADFTVRYFNAGDTAFADLTDTDHIITEIGNGWYKYNGAAIASTLTDTAGRGVMEVVYDPSSLPTDYVSGVVWTQVFLVDDVLSADVVRVSGDSAAADALELQFDGTGLTGATYPARQDGAEVVRGTAGGGTTSSITLGASALAVDDVYNGALIMLVGGTGAGQFATISDYDGTSKVATISGTWPGTTPDATTKFVIRGVALSTATLGAGAITSSTFAAGAINLAALAADVTSTLGIVRRATAQTGSTSTTIKLDASASSTDDAYNKLSVYIASGTGAGQERTIIDYVGSTLVATVDEAWAVTPDNTSVFVIRAGAPTINGIARADGLYAIEGSATRDDLIRLLVGLIAGTATGFDTDTQVYKSLDGSKTRITVTTDETGRLSIIVGDLT